MHVTDIIMSAPMVRAILREIEKPGTGKTATRRLAFTEIKTRKCASTRAYTGIHHLMPNRIGYTWVASKWQKVKPGDRIWVRENARADEHAEDDRKGVRYLADDAWSEIAPGEDAYADWFRLNAYRSDDPDLTGGQVVRSIHMPRWASRLTLEVTGVEIEHLQSITYIQARAEGVDYLPGADDPRESFQRLWDSLHGAGAWKANPEVVAISFKPYLCNVDQMKEAA